MTKGETLRCKIAAYKRKTGYDHFNSEQRKIAGNSLINALKAFPNMDNKEIMKEYYQIRKGYDSL